MAAGAVIPCTDAFECPRAADPCVVSTCVDRVCVTVDAAEKTLVPGQTSGDCKLMVCDGRGGTVAIEDAADWPADDGDECTDEVCEGSEPEHPPLAVGSACGQGGVCNGAGTCGACLPGARQCRGNEPQACGDDGGWTSPGPCPEESPACAKGACVSLVEVATGYRHSCARFQDGAVRCWGDRGAGKLGDGAVSRVVTLSGAVELTSGERHTCARLTGGAVACWGRNDDGQLGDRTRESRGAPVAVGGVSHAAQIAAGAGHTCARTDAGQVLCWGRNDKGQLGDGTVKKTSKPPVVEPDALGGTPPSSQRMKVPVLGVERAAGLSLGADHACALLQDTSVACWGDNASGQLGLGSLPGSSPKGKPHPPGSSPRPLAPVRNLSGVAFVALGASHTCALLADGAVQCWGDNAYGQLGDGTTTSRPLPVTVSGLSGAVGLALGRHHSCAWLGDGSARCWGRNAAGQLGDGTTENRLAPAQVTGLAGVSKLTSRGDHCCARLSSGAVRCWGANAAGQLGDGGAADRPTPGPIAW